MKFLSVILFASWALAQGVPSEAAYAWSQVTRVLVLQANKHFDGITGVKDSLQSNTTPAFQAQALQSLRVHYFGLVYRFHLATQEIHHLVNLGVDDLIAGIIPPASELSAAALSEWKEAAYAAHRLVHAFSSIYITTTTTLGPEFNAGLELEHRAFKEAVGPFLVPLMGMLYALEWEGYHLYPFKTAYWEKIVANRDILKEAYERWDMVSNSGFEHEE